MAPGSSSRCADRFSACSSFSRLRLVVETRFTRRAPSSFVRRPAPVVGLRRFRGSRQQSPRIGRISAADVTVPCCSASGQGLCPLDSSAICMSPDWHSAQRRQLQRSRSSVMIPRCMSSTSSRQHARQMIDTRTYPGGGGSMRPASVPHGRRGSVTLASDHRPPAITSVTRCGACSPGVCRCCSRSAPRCPRRLGDFDVAGPARHSVARCGAAARASSRAGKREHATDDVDAGERTASRSGRLPVTVRAAC